MRASTFGSIFCSAIDWRRSFFDFFLAASSACALARSGGDGTLCDVSVHIALADFHAAVMPDFDFPANPKAPVCCFPKGALPAAVSRSWKSFSPTVCPWPAASKSRCSCSSTVKPLAFVSRPLASDLKSCASSDELERVLDRKPKILLLRLFPRDRGLSTSCMVDEVASLAQGVGMLAPTMCRAVEMGGESVRCVRLLVRRCVSLRGTRKTERKGR